MYSEKNAEDQGIKFHLIGVYGGTLGIKISAKDLVLKIGKGW